MKRLMMIMVLMLFGLTTALVDDLQAGWNAGQQNTRPETIASGSHHGDGAIRNHGNQGGGVQREPRYQQERRTDTRTHKNWASERHYRPAWMHHHDNRHFYHLKHAYGMGHHEMRHPYMRNHERAPWWWKPQDRQGRW